jgi:hypothetical protein
METHFLLLSPKPARTVQSHRSSYRELLNTISYLAQPGFVVIDKGHHFPLRLQASNHRSALG